MIEPKTLTFDEYLKLPYASSHRLIAFTTHSPAAAWDSTPATPAMDLGTAVHAAVLTPDAFESNYTVKPDGASRASLAARQVYVDWLSGVLGEDIADAPGVPASPPSARLDGMIAYGAEQMEARGISVISAADHDAIRAISDNVASHPIASELLAGAPHRELSLVGYSERLGINIKARLDAYGAGAGIVELKTTRDCSQRGFARDAAKLRYHDQLGLYSMVVEEYSNVPYTDHTIIAAETENPYRVAVWQMPSDVIDRAIDRMTTACALWQACEQAGKFPGPGWKMDGTAEIGKLMLPWE